MIRRTTGGSSATMAIAASRNTATSGFASTKPTITCAKVAIAATIWSGWSGGSGGIAVERVPCFAPVNVAWRRSIASGKLVRWSMWWLPEPG